MSVNTEKVENHNLRGKVVSQPLKNLMFVCANSFMDNELTNLVPIIHLILESNFSFPRKSLF